jgi:hypothetical protein
MKYLCLIYCDESITKAMSKREWDALNAECIDYSDELQGAGHGLAMAALQSVDAATTVRVRGGRLSTTDGPFAETHEQLAGFYLLEARDLDAAVTLAQKIPPARLGSVEIRPVRQVVTEGNSQT